MKKYSKLIIAAIIALIFIGTFVFLWQKSQPKEVVYNEFRRPLLQVRLNLVMRFMLNRRFLVSSQNSTKSQVIM